MTYELTIIEAGEIEDEILSPTASTVISLPSPGPANINKLPQSLKLSPKEKKGSTACLKKRQSFPN